MKSFHLPSTKFSDDRKHFYFDTNLSKYSFFYSSRMSGRQTSGGNRTNQCNPTHTPSGPGHSAPYGGTGTKSDLNNHSNQGNPNNSQYGGGGGQKSAGRK